jgi:uncharacterized FlgJ-related protein
MNIEKEIRYSVWRSVSDSVDNLVCNLVYNSVYWPIWESIDKKVVNNNSITINIASEIKEYGYK